MVVSAALTSHACMIGRAEMAVILSTLRLLVEFLHQRCKCGAGLPVSGVLLCKMTCSHAVPKCLQDTVAASPSLDSHSVNTADTHDAQAAKHKKLTLCHSRLCCSSGCLWR